MRSLIIIKSRTLEDRYQYYWYRWWINLVDLLTKQNMNNMLIKFGVDIIGVNSIHGLNHGFEVVYRGEFLGSKPQ